jgi:hypothetical protein
MNSRPAPAKAELGCMIRDHRFFSAASCFADLLGAIHGDGIVKRCASHPDKDYKTISSLVYSNN